MSASKLILLFILLSDLAARGQVPTFERTYNDTMGLSSYSSRPVELDSGRYYIANSGFGVSLPEGGYERIFSFNDQGDIIRDNFQYDSTRRYSEISRLIKSADGNLVLTGTRTLKGGTGGNRIFVQKITPDFADTVWSFYYHDSIYYDGTRDLLEMPNGDIVVIASRSFIDDSYDLIFIRINEGVLLADTIINEDAVDIGRSIELLADGNLLIGGTRGTDTGHLKGLLMKVNPQGEVLLSRSYPQVYEGGISIYDANKYIFGGYFNGPKILFIDSGGGVFLNRSYPYSQPGVGGNYIARKVSDGGIVAAGITTNAVESNAGYIMKTDSNGNALWQKRYNHGNWVDYFIDFIETKDGGLLVSGAADDDFCCGGQNAWVVKLDANGCLDPSNCTVSIEDAPFPDAISIYPNPVKDWLTIELVNSEQNYTAQLLDATGRLLQQEIFSELGTHTLSLQGLAVGVYYCRILKGVEVFTWEKIVKVE
jgi:hypothetical protein